MTLTEHKLPKIYGYNITKQIYLGSKTGVYRAVHEKRQLPVVIKVLQREYPTFGELVQFRNQYAITKNLPIAGIVQPLSLETFGNGYALVMPDWGGISLEKYIQQHQLDLAEKLAITLQITDILQELHSSRVIHKDIKPANILIHPESKQVKLIDFSIASLLPKETQEIQNPNVLEGTLAYLAPEQTGRMNRGIDYRSDFYAFGVTLYQLLTDRLPFITDDPLELVHCHIAKIATPANHINTDVPKMVGAIVAKLMAKNAEDRYQSALGIKHDLGECLNQWKETGSIAEFELGQRDLCDRFVIPEKLYGRSSEVQMLLDSFERVAEGISELMLVAGFSGIGKTAVVNEVHKPITRQRGYFIKGKFDQFNRNIPLSAFVQAFRSLMGQLLSESDTELQEWKSKILEAVGENGQVLIEVIPELQRIIGSQPPVPELSGSAAQNRFNLLFQKFIAVFTTPDHPLVMFLDDLQWADSASLNLLNLLMAESETAYLLVLGAYRDNEVFPAHPLMLTLEDIKTQQAQIHTLTLKPLTETHINQLVADTLLCTTELATPLAELVYQKTQGNPFFATQFLQGLYEENCITFEATAGYWQCDLAQVRQLALTDDVVEFMAQKLQRLPTETQEVLKLAACIGNQFDLNTLAIASNQSPTLTATALWKALQEGLIVPLCETYKFFQDNDDVTSNSEVTAAYKFLHDRVQQAAYSLIPEDQKQSRHYQIGKLLLQQMAPEERESHIFELVNQLNYGVALITQPDKREELAQLNLLACRKARNATAYSTSREYAAMGLSLMPDNAWQQHYDMSLAFHDLGAELAFLCRDFEAMEQFMETILQQSRSLLDRVLVYRIKIQATASQNKLLEAVNIARQFLAQLGIMFPESPTEADVSQELTEVRQLIGSRPIESLTELPQMTDAQQIAIVQIANGIMPAVYLSCPALFPLLVCATIRLSLEYGNAPASAYSYACYGLIACKLMQEVSLGVQFGQLALQVVSKLNAKAIQPDVATAVGSCILHRKAHMRTMLPVMREGYEIALEIGNVEFAGYNAHLYCLDAFWCNQLLPTLKQETSTYCHTLVQFNQLTSANYCRLYWQSALNLIGESENPTALSGEALSEAKWLPQMLEVNDLYGLYFFYLSKLMLCYLFGDIESAQQHSISIEPYFEVGTGSVGEPAFYFYDSLTALAALDKASSAAKAATELLQKIDQNQTQMQQHWASHAPMNYQHKVDLVEAERCRLRGQKTEVIDLYDRAIAGAKENEYIQEEALANELAAKFYLDWGKEKVASEYMQEAYYCYARWGAKAKINDLEQRYPNLLCPILQSEEGATGTWKTLTTISPLTTSVNSGIHKSSSSTSINQALDFAAILKASQALSSNIELDQLLHQLTQIILQNSGADNCALILPDESGEWQVRAIATPDDTQLCAQPLTSNPNLPVKLINYVKNTQEIVVINELKTDLPVIDDYLRQRQPKSLLCLPLLSQGQLIGILYLKNQFTIGAFTGERVEVLNFLCTQAAISLENARLYKKAQEYAQQLEQSQLQVVQSEKMASLGNLVAGVAHEINNPLGFLNGSISNGKDYVQDILEYLETYHQQQPPNNEVEELAEDLDLEFLLEDLPKLLESMQGATNRIKNISTSLRTFSRADRDHKVNANLHEGLDSTLLILKYRLKANDYRPAIQVTKDYGNLPTIECFPGQLNQVFMNILANGIDMFDEMAQTQSFKEIEANPQQITIRTQIESNQVYIRIRDNGKGMSQDVQAKIFDNLFTTKDVGKGTGLGLAIARQIVVEKHGGSLDVWSEPGQGTEFCICLPIHY